MVIQSNYRAHFRNKGSIEPDGSLQTQRKKQAPIVFWDFEIDEKKKIAFKTE
jgi:hypothetical protein